MHPELNPRDYGKAGGKRPGAGRPKGSTTAQMAKKRAEGSASIRFISQKRERELWDKAIGLAVKNRNVNALIKILITVAEFHYGKPYEAINPMIAGKPKPTDDRLLMAIRTLNIGVSQSPSSNSALQTVESTPSGQLIEGIQTNTSKCDTIKADKTVASQGESAVQDER